MQILKKDEGLSGCILCRRRFKEMLSVDNTLLKSKREEVAGYRQEKCGQKSRTETFFA